MSEHNALQQLAMEVAELRRAIIEITRVKGDKLSRANVCERMGWHRNTLANKIKAREFPEPGKDGKWLLSEVMEWEAQR